MDTRSGPPYSSASDSGVSMLAVKVDTSTPCMPGATIQSGSPTPDRHGMNEELPCENSVSRAQMPGTVVSFQPDGGCSRGSE